jgi:hypothetical protein
VARRPTAIAIALVAAATLACNQHLLPQGRTLAGRLILDQATPVERGGGECRGTGGYADLRSGVRVEARDGEGALLATGALTAQPPPTDAQGGIPQAERRRCVWAFRLEALPPRDAYEIAIGDRGRVTYTRQELDAAGWNVDVSLGG